MAQEYLPAPSNVRLADLMKEHNISQPELAKEIGCSKSTISRFISGAKGTLTHEQVLRIARLFNVSTDFLLGETNIPDRKNYDIAELGLSVEAAKNLYTGRVNAEVVNLLLENARFAELTYRIAQYFDYTFLLRIHRHDPDRIHLHRYIPAVAELCTELCKRECRLG